MPIVKPKIIVICGPTSSGKSDVAIRLAKKFKGEIISADSRQIYKGMDLGTGKVRGAWNMENGTFDSEGIPHHMIDIVDPMEDFNVSHFKKKAEQCILEISKRGKVPIVCGGTGFWISALVDGVELPKVEPDDKLRGMLSGKTTEELFLNLQKLDPERAKNIDPKNKVRLIRAIEIAKALGKVPEKSSAIGHQKYEFLQIGIEIAREELNSKIKKRLNERFEQGMIEEVAKLIENGVKDEWFEKIGLEYRWISRYLQGEIALENEMSARGGCVFGAKEKLYFDIIHYAKRQMTWLNKNKKILWFKEYRGIEDAAAKFLK